MKNREEVDEAQDVKIEPMAPADISEVVAIEELSFPTKWQAGAYESELRNPTAYYIVARAGAQVAGYAGMWSSGDEAHVTTLAVHPDFRRRGIGERLLVNLLEEARRRKVTRMTLEVRAANKPARRLYEKHGFIPIAHLPGYYADTGEDGVVMWQNPLPAEHREPMRLIVLKSVHDTIRAETLLKGAGIPHRVIPKPVSIAADCGLAIIFEAAHEEALLEVLAREQMGIEVMCDYAPGKGAKGEEGA